VPINFGRYLSHKGRFLLTKEVKFGNLQFVKYPKANCHFDWCRNFWQNIS